MLILKRNIYNALIVVRYFLTDNIYNNKFYLMSICLKIQLFAQDVVAVIFTELLDCMKRKKSAAASAALLVKQKTKLNKHTS